VENHADPVNRKFAQLYLVDLAGSERADKTGVWGKQLDEAKIINKSLLSLGQVIVALSEKAAHIPYRDSKLTRVLQNVLGGNSRTTLICAASPHPDNANESLSTLRFGNRASRIRNETRMNIVLDPKELKKQLDQAKAEIEKCRKDRIPAICFANLKARYGSAKATTRYCTRDEFSGCETFSYAPKEDGWICYDDKAKCEGSKIGATPQDEQEEALKDARDIDKAVPSRPTRCVWCNIPIKK